MKYGERGRSQHLDETFDVRDMLILSSEYVNDLNQRNKKNPNSAASGGGF